MKPSSNNGVWLTLLIGFVTKVKSAEFDNETYTDLLQNEALNTFQLAKKYGYPIERHSVTTEDGYIIEIHRIPHGINSTDISNRPPVLIGHGTGGSAVEFLLMGPRSMAFRLAEAGYDIWIGNARGTSWSQKHTSLNTRSKQYWMFSWHEIGLYDYSAEIMHMINITGQDKVFFIGHSQGASAYLAMASDRPEMNKKIRLAVLVAPTAYSRHNKNPLILVMAENIKYIEGIMDYLHIYGIPQGLGVTNFIRMICKSALKFLCTAYINLTMGYDSQNIDWRLTHVAASSVPAGFSVRQMDHYGQMFRARKFQKYDYGPEENMKRYGSVGPPLYDLSKVTAPVGLIYGTSDAFVSVEDGQDLCRDLPNCAFNYMINKTMWNHISYLFGKDADRNVNDKLIEMMNQY